MSTSTYDVIVIGAGPAGEVAAGALAERGLAVALVEGDLVGGECAFYACMPSKALLRPSEVLREARRIPGAAEALTSPLDVSAVLARRDEVIHHLDDASQLQWLSDRGITLIRGHARLDGERAVAIDGGRQEAREAIIVAVGSAAVVPEIPGLADARPWTSHEVTVVRSLPSSLVVIGGGVVGVEMAQAYCDLGVAVTIVEAADRLIAREEPFAGEQLGASFRERGIDLRLGAQVRSVERSAGDVVVDLGGAGSVTAQEILVAIGRRPRTDDLGVETVGLEPGASIDVDDTLRVAGLPWLYAVGDVNGRSLQTHSGKYQARVAVKTIMGVHARATADRGAPRVIFTEPQVAAVGLTLSEAKDRGINAHAYEVPTSATAGASFHGRDTPGTSQLVIDEDRAVIVGATFTGSEVAEWLQAATIALIGEVPIDRLWHAIPVFPTRSEIWLRLLEHRERRLLGD